MKKDHDIVKHMKGQSGWGWGPTSFLSKVDDDAWEKYIVVSICTSYV
jgi:hypothetical protein